MMAEIDPAEVFRQEAAELMEQLELALLDLDRTPHDAALVATAFRALHTLKGSGAMFGFDRVAAFIHNFETAFDRVRKGQAEASPALIKIALEAQDHIRCLIETPERADDAAGAAVIERLAAVTRGDVRDLPATAAAAAQAVADEGGVARDWRLSMAFSPDVMVNGTNPILLFDELRSLGPCTLAADATALPPLHELDPEKLYLTWSATVTTGAPKSAFEEVFIFVADDMRLELEASPTSAVVLPEASRLATAPVGEAPAPILAAPTAAVPTAMVPMPSLPMETASVSAAAPTSRQAPAPARDAATLRVPAERLDEMMDRVGELVIVQARLSQLAANGRDGVKSVAEDIARLTSALREAMMGIRMVPVGTLFSRFRRLIHDLARDCGKTIEFVTGGDETELDKTMIERLADPLVHIIRNCADHGLEDEATRLAAGKAAAGRIEVVARHAGTEVLLSIRDDGRGLDARRIRLKAEEQGLVQPGAALSDAELYPLIFAPGFSTAKEVSALSGRGVGMDVVKKTIEGMRGSIDIATTAGQGSTITLRLPLTLAIIEGLLVRVADSRYVIPLVAVEECVELSDMDDARSKGRSFLNVRGDLIPFLRLREVFADEGGPDAFQKIVIVANGDMRVGLVVDQIIGSHQTVIKSLSKLHADVSSFSGATILGDGSVALILDIPQVIALGRTLETRHKSMEIA